jgi:3D (Asp-Asp-Asp) domain-containing protein
MNRLQNRRFKKGLSSGLSILAIFAVGYLFDKAAGSVLAANNPSATNKPSQVDSIDIPGTFKELSSNADAITSKRTVEETTAAPEQSHQAETPADSQKGVVTSASSYKGSAGEIQDFQATAYCLKGRTASGEYTRVGVIAADPSVLPLGTVVHIRAGRYTGTYTVLDTGGRIKGRTIDIYLPTYQEAVRFGRQRIKIQVLGRARSNSGRVSADPATKSAVMANL